MKVCALISGGKDSCYNMMKAVEHGHEIRVLANLCPQDAEKQELDSFCFQTVGHNAVEAIAAAMELPLVRRKFSGVAVVKELHYATPTDEDEVEDLYELLLSVKQQYPQVEAVSCGAILSTYQRLRVESVCSRLNLKSLAYMWQRDQIDLLNNMVEKQLDAILIKVASHGITPKEHLGKSILQLRTHFLTLREQYGFQACGEGGEYETFTLDCPLFKSKIVIDKSDIIITDEKSNVGHLVLEKYHLQKKIQPSTSTTPAPAPPSPLPPPAPPSSPPKPNNSSKEQKVPTKVEQPKATLSNSSAISIQLSKSKCSTINNFVFTSEIIGNTSSSLENEINSMMSNMLKTMESHRVMPSDILYVNLHVTDMSLFGQINKIYCKYFHYNPPSRACVEVTSNLQNGAKCMADCMGYVNSGQCIGDRRVQVVRDVLHVQSISEWAPTCIGPYSQANMLSGIHYQAGQIGLDPASMTLVPGGWENETTQTLQNIHAVLKCCKSSIANILSCVVWINTSTNVNTLGVKEVIKKWLNKNVPTQNHFIGEEKISFIPVPNLPRGAAVELQIIAMENHIFSQSNPLLMMQKWQNMQLVEEEEKTKEDKEIQRSFIDFHGVYVNGLVCVGHSRFYFSNIDSIHEISANLKNVLNSFNDIIEKQSNMTWSVVNQLQIYYCGNASIHARIRSLFEECWNSTIVDRKGMLPALSFVPVDKQNENERENTTTTNEDRNNSTSSNEESEEDVSAIFGDGDDVRFGESGSNSSSEPTKAPPTDNMFIQIFIKAFNIEALSHLVKQNIDSTQAVSKSHSNLSKEIEKEDDDEEQLDMNDDFVSLNGGFTAAMKAVEEADQADELASECSDMSDTDANIFDGMPMSGAIGSDSESDDDIGTN